MSENTFENIADEFLDFVQLCPTCYHVVEKQRTALLYAGYTQLFESTPFDLVPGGKYFVTRGGSSLIAFRVPEGKITGFLVSASHSDSPSFKVKANPEITENGYTKLNVERYGGMLMAPWFDRPLSVAGRVITREETTDGVRLVSHLVNIPRDLLVIPSLAIHMNREANSGFAPNPQTDLLPLFGDESAKGKFLPLVARYAGVSPDAIEGYDLFLYPTGHGSLVGAGQEFLLSPRIDDLMCAYGCFRGFLAAGKTKGNGKDAPSSLPVYALFDNEEVGSLTRQGSDSTFLKDTLENIFEALHLTPAQYRAALQQSFMVSADNAHAVHPNHPEKADPVNRPKMNGGIVIKYAANQKYTSTGESAALFFCLCKKAGVPVQVFTNRSDMAGGSTLGNLETSHVPLNAVDIGLAQLAMHSSWECAGVKDLSFLARAMEFFFASTLTVPSPGVLNLSFPNLKVEKYILKT